MVQRCTSLLFIITRAAIGSVALPLSLVLGLLAAPVSCQCGSAMPHDHSLYILGNHTHASGMSESRSHSHPGEQTEVTNDGPRNAAEVRAEGPTLRAATDYAAGQTRALALLPAALSLETREYDSIIVDYLPVDSHSSPIDPPPPKA